MNSYKTQISKEEGKVSEFAGKRKMFKTICSDCGKDAEVPFEPSGDRPVYCRECYQKRRRY